MFRTTVILATGTWKAGSEQRAMTPDPADPADPRHPQLSSQIGDFIERVVIFGLDGAPSCLDRIPLGTGPLELAFLGEGRSAEA